VRGAFAHYLLGTEAFLSVCLDPHSAPYGWLWHQGPRRLSHEGIVISAASTEMADARLKKLRDSGDRSQQDFADRCQERIDSVIALFRAESCVVPITDVYWRFARHQLPDDITYLSRVGGESVVIGVLEKVVLATAILGVDQPMWLIDYEQKAFEVLRVAKQLAVGTFPHPANQLSLRVAAL
jgi:hypothetical protein